MHTAACVCKGDTDDLSRSASHSTSSPLFDSFRNFFIQQVDFCELPAVLVLAIVKNEKQALVELHNKSSHKTGEMPMAALRDQLDRASLFNALGIHSHEPSHFPR